MTALVQKQRDDKGLFLPGHSVRNIPNLTDADEVITTIDNYFQECEAAVINRKVVSNKELIDIPIPKAPTMAGLARAMGMSRDALNDYRQRNHSTRNDTLNRISFAISHARARIEEINLDLGLSGIHDSKLSALNLGTNFNYATKSEKTERVIDESKTDEQVVARIEHLLGVKQDEAVDVTPKLSFL